MDMDMQSIPDHIGKCFNALTGMRMFPISRLTRASSSLELGFNALTGMRMFPIQPISCKVWERFTSKVSMPLRA